MDIFCVTETWLHDGETSTVASLLPDTHIFHHFPRTTGSGGGVGVAVSRSIDSSKAINRSCESFECLELHVIKNFCNITTFSLNQKGFKNKNSKESNSKICINEN